MKIEHELNVDSPSAFFERKEISNVRRKLVPALEANGNAAFRRGRGVSDLNVKRKPPHYESMGCEHTNDSFKFNRMR
jgi:hypothetical protein